MEYPDVPSNSPSPSPTPRGGGGGGATGSGGDSPTQIPSRPASPELPLTMTASAILTSLPRDASSALASASRPSASQAPSAGPGNADADADRKVVVRFKAVGGGAPRLRRDLRKIGAAQRFESVVVHLRRALRLADTQGLFCYVNSAFAPALDEVVGNLHQVSFSPRLFSFLSPCRPREG